MQLMIEIANKSLEKRVLNMLNSLKEDDLKIISIKNSNKDSSIDRVKKLKGLGKELYSGVDSDKYIKELRDEW